MRKLRAIDPYLKIENLRWGWKYGMTPTLELVLHSPNEKSKESDVIYSIKLGNGSIKTSWLFVDLIHIND